MRIVLLALVLLMSALAGCSDDTGDGEDDGGAMTGAEDPMEDGVDDTDEASGETEESGGAGNGTSGQNGTSGNNGTSGKRGAVTWDVSIIDNDFVEGSITIQVGDTVRWTQEGSNPHTVTSDDGTFDSTNGVTNRMTQQVNNQFQYTFDAVGEFSYFCEVHPSMTDVITVLERFDGRPS